MAKEIIINAQPDQTRIAIVEDGELVELYIENPDNARTLGDIYLGRVKRILPGIKAAFVDVGQKQDAFLHFSDLSDNLPEILAFVGEDVPGLPKDRALPRHPHPRPDTRPGEHPGLETETPEEERAAKRLREVSRRRDEDDEAPAAEEAAGPTPEAAEAEDKPKRRRRRGGRRRRKSGDAGQTPSDEPRADAADEEQADDEPQEKPRPKRKPRAKAVVPDEHTPPADDAGTEAPETPPTETQPEDEQPEDEQPKKRRSRRKTSDDDEAGEAEADEKPKRARARRKKADAAQDADAQAEGADAPETEAEPAPKKPRSRSRKKAAEPAATPEPSPEAPAPASPEAPPASPEAPPASPEAPAAQPAQDAKSVQPSPKPAEKPKEKKKPSSRFVIDLTSRPGRLDPDDAEEEEEEEDRAGGRTRNRSSRRSSGRERRRSGGSRDGAGRGSRNDSGGNGGNGSDQDAPVNGDDEDVSEPPRIERDRPIQAYLKQGQQILAKIIKEPISAKGSRVSTDISLAGRFLVLVPLADYVAVSKKISSPKERKRLRALARSLLPAGFGLIVRTVAEGRDAKALDTDLQLLLKKWRKIESGVRSAKKPPVLVHEDVDMVSSVIRDLFSEDYDRILVDDPNVYRQIKNYVTAVAPDMAKVVVRHTSNENVFRAAGIDKQVTAAFERRVSLPGGGYLFIEHTEAMHVVDVNSGRAGRGLSQEENALRVNLEAAKEITKQLRLRDLGGIICVDFIDMRSDSYRKKVHDEFKKHFKKDRAVTKILPMSDFGVVQITRQRLRPSVTTQASAEDMDEASGQDNVHGRPEPEAFPSNPAVPARRATIPDEAPTAAEVIQHLEDWLSTYREEVSEQHRRRPVLLRIHPFLAAYLQRGLPSTFFRWRVRYRFPIQLEVDEHANPLAFSVLDEKSGKDLTRKYDPARRVEDEDDEA